SLMERRLGGEFIFDVEHLPYGYPELIDLFEIAGRMKAARTLRRFWPNASLPDEPPLKLWYAEVNDRTKNQTGGGSVKDDRDALTRCLAEANERYLWYERSDFGLPLKVGTASHMQRKGHAIMPDQFAGLSTKQREEYTRLRITPDTEFAWIRGRSLVRSRDAWIPLQTVSACLEIPGHSVIGEPFIRPKTSNGLASQTTATGAIAAGALELI